MIIPSPRRCLISVSLRLLEIKHFFRLVDGVLLSLTTSLNSVALSISFENLVIPTGTNAHRISYCSPLTKMATHFSIRAVRLLVIKKSLSLTSNVDSLIYESYTESQQHTYCIGAMSLSRGFSPPPANTIYMAEVPCFSPFSFHFFEFGAQVQASDFRFLYLTNNKKGVGKSEL